MAEAGIITFGITIGMGIVLTIVCFSIQSKWKTKSLEKAKT